FFYCDFYFVFFFFFSSRRRHTRWPRDWSSDVCSSDLSFAVQVFLGGEAARTTAETLEKQLDNPQVLHAKLDDTRREADLGVIARSEERRVGKEWRWGRWGEQ